MKQKTEKVERNRAIADRIKAGATLGAVARKYGITPQRVRRIAERYGVVSAHRIGVSGFRICEEDVQRVLELYDRRMPFAHIGKTVGCDVGTARRIAGRYRGYTPTAQHDPWTKDEESFVRSTYKKSGWSASKIGRMLGRTRFEVIGKAYRLRKEDAERIEQRAA